MALKYSYRPTADVAGYGATQSALTRWLERQKRSRAQFSAAEQPLQQSVQMFQPGGGYGRGQETLLRGEARRAQAEATSQQVASGMSSGSLATGTRMRTERDLAAGLTGVEDVRTQFLNQALSNLSGLRGQQAGITAQTADPTFAPTMGYLSSRFGQVGQLNQAMMGAGSRVAAANIQAGNKPVPRARPTASFNIPGFSR
jgi:hypothetical protein